MGAFGNGGGPSSGDLATHLSDLARALEESDSVQDTLDAIVATAVDTVPGAAHAGLMVVTRRRRTDTRAVTGDLVQQIDRAQYDTGQGPCLEAIHEQRIVHLPDMAREERWPDFTGRVLGLGILSMLSFRLYVRRDTLGALNLYATRPGAFTTESEYVGMLFATHAAVAMSDAQRLQQLETAVDVRDLIGQAKGILMERHKVTSDRAFHLLVRASQTTNTRLVDVARHLTDAGELRSPEEV